MKIISQKEKGVLSFHLNGVLFMKFRILPILAMAISIATFFTACEKSYTCKYDEKKQTLACVEKTYKTVKIEGKTWLAENLNRIDIAGASNFCYNDDVQKCKQYGSLYPYEAATRICPDGWSLPTQNDFEEAAQAIENLAIQKAGFRYYDGKSADEGISASFWTSDSFDDSRAVMVRVTESVAYEHFNKNIAASVRCVKK